MINVREKEIENLIHKTHCENILDTLLYEENIFLLF